MSLLNKNHVKNYLFTLPQLVIELTESDLFQEFPYLLESVPKLIFKTVPNNETLHGLATALCYLHIAKEKVDDGRLKECYVLGWCLQMYATCYIITDDFVDKSKTRHYKSCWYLEKKKGKNVFLDALLLENIVFFLLEKHFSCKSYFLEMVQLFQKAQWKMAYANELEERLLMNGDLRKMNFMEYAKCVSYKMSYFPTKIHCICAILVAGISSHGLIEDASRILSLIDFHFQVRDDFLDCYGQGDKTKENDEELGTDIEIGRCSWNICSVLSLATFNQRKELQTHYGKKGHHVDIVKRIYDEVNLPKLFEDYEATKLKFVQNVLHSRQNCYKKLVPDEMFEDMMWASFPKLRCKSNNTETSTRKKEDIKEFFIFFESYPEFITLVLNCLINNSLLNKRRLLRMLHYNVLPGKKSRGLMVSKIVGLLHGDNYSQQQGSILGWCVELLQASALIADDEMDQGTLRRGRPCWYLCRSKLGQKSSGMLDALFLESLVYQVLQLCCNNKEHCEKLTQLFQTITTKTTYGQQLDICFGKGCDINKYTEENYEILVRYKTSYYSFVLPFLSALILTNMEKDTNCVNEATRVLLLLGHYFQAKDDYIDVFQSSSKTGKVGGDIREKKCTWLITTALKLANLKQKEELESSYGKNEPNVVKVFQDLDLKLRFSEMKDMIYKEIRNKIETSWNLSKEIKQVLEWVVDKVFETNTEEENGGPSKKMKME